MPSKRPRLNVCAVTLRGQRFYPTLCTCDCGGEVVVRARGFWFQRRDLCLTTFRSTSSNPQVGTFSLEPLRLEIMAHHCTAVSTRGTVVQQCKHHPVSLHLAPRQIPRLSVPMVQLIQKLVQSPCWMDSTNPRSFSCSNVGHRSFSILHLALFSA